MKRVSVIVPVYNGSEHIENSFRFLSEQKYENFEVIYVVDIETKDDTYEKIEECIPFLKDAKVIIQEDEDMLGGARNLGIKHAEGEIIWFFDVDDRPLPDFLSDLVPIMEENGADIVSCNFIRSSSLDPGTVPVKEYRIRAMDRDSALRARLKEKIPVTAWSKIISKRLIDENDLRFIRGYAEDIEFSYHSMSFADKIYYYEKPLYIYYQNSGSLCNGGMGDNLRGEAEISAYDRLEEFFKNDQSFGATFKVGATKTRMRSAVHMEKERFIEYSRSKACRDMIKRNLSLMSPEALIFKTFPGLYYIAVKTFLKKIHYKDGRCFTRV
ncbi:MAG: glycosyltransferase [Methanomassiliicoccaceae archaeon]|nr:glycosyltransferase [Methanomassiliicoccaceae archaeon]